MKRIVILAAMMVAASAVAHSAGASDASACMAKKDDKERLACFDAVAKNQSSAPENTSPAQPAAAAKVALEPAAKAIKLTGNDLAVQTHKWDGRTVETKVRCFYADKNEFRCLALQGAARIDFERIEPAEVQTHVENECDTIEKSSRKACAFTVQFIYEGFGKMDTDSGFVRQVTTVIAKDFRAFNAKR